jgi:HSP20 family protein
MMSLMSIYRPGGLANQLNEEMNRMFAMNASQDDVAANSSDWVPAVDIIEDEKSYTIHADVPGVKPEEVEVEIENGVLIMKGERQETKKDEKEGYKRIERVSGNFYRRFTLPKTVNADDIKAKTQHGVLEVIIPKQAKPEPKRIQVTG